MPGIELRPYILSTCSTVSYTSVLWVQLSFLHSTISLSEREKERERERESVCSEDCVWGMHCWGRELSTCIQRSEKESRHPALSLHLTPLRQDLSLNLELD